MPYNILTCSGFEGAGTGWVASVPCLKARVGLVLLFFIVAMIRKWGGEEIGIDFNFPVSLIAAFISYFIVITISGSFKWAFVLGMAAALVGGYGFGLIFGEWGGDE